MTTDVFDRMKGELSVTRSALYEVLRMLSEEQLRHLHDVHSGTLSDLSAHWGPPERLSPFQEGILDAMKAFNVRLRHPDKFLPGDESAPKKPYFLCGECGTPILVHADFMSSTCPKCGTNRWLELVYV